MSKEIGFRLLGTQWSQRTRNEENRMFKELYDMTISNEDYLHGFTADIQRQLDNLILNAGESDAEVVQARGKYSLLYQRFNNLDAQINVMNNTTLTNFDKNMKRKSQRNFIDFKKQFSPSESKASYQVIGDRVLEVYLPIDDKESVVYKLRKDTLDDFIRLHQSVIDKKTVTSSEVNYDSVTTGTMIASVGNYNAYTTEIGTTVKLTFTGSEIYMRHFYDNRGGVWECRVDGVLVNVISTHESSFTEGKNELNPSKEAVRLIVDNLEEKQHVLEMKFIGEDPNNPSISGEARGWIRNVSGAVTKTNIMYTGFVVNSIEDKGKIAFMNGESNKEFAFSCRKAGTSDDYEWLPQHNNKSTLNLYNGGFQKMLVDGIDVKLDEISSIKYFNNLIITQKLQYIHPQRSEVFANVLVTMSVTKENISIVSKIEWLQDVEIQSGYGGMLPIQTGKVSEKLVTSLGDVYTPIGSERFDVDITDVAEGFAFVGSDNDVKDYFTVMQITNSNKSMRRGLPNRKGRINHVGANWLLSDSILRNKLYTQIYSSATVEAGTIDVIEATFFTGKIPEVYTTLVD